MRILPETKQITVLPCFLDGFALRTRVGNVLKLVKKYRLQSGVVFAEKAYQALPEILEMKYVNRDKWIEDYRLN